MDLVKCSKCGGKIKRDEKQKLGVCQDCGWVNRYAFISYSTKNKQASEYVFHVFTEQGIPVWMAPYDIPVGEVYAGVISQALSNCSCMVLLLSEASQASAWVGREVEAVISSEKPLLPVQLEDLELNDTFRFFIQSNQIMMLPKMDEKSANFQRLITAVRSYVDEDGGHVVPSMAVPEMEMFQGKGNGLLCWFRQRKKLAAGIGAALVLLAAVVVSDLLSARKSNPERSTTAVTVQVPETVAQYQDWKHNVLMSDSYIEGSDLSENREVYQLGISRRDVVSVTFLDTTEQAPSDAQDVSLFGDGSVLAWAEEYGKNFKLYFAANGGINGAQAAPRMFEAYTSLVEIDFGGALHTEDAYDMRCMFLKCSSLKKLDLSGIHTENVGSMYRMFSGCSRLESLDISGFYTVNVTTMAYMFSGCYALKDLDISNFNAANVVDLSNMFSSCTSLQELDLSNFHAVKTTDMSRMFYNCKNLTALDISGIDTGTVKMMSGLFRDCASLKSLDVSGFDTGKVTDMAGMFGNCKSLEQLDLSGFNTESVTDMGSMFSGCDRLEQVDVSNFKTENVKSMAHMFFLSGSLKELDLSGFDTRNVTDMTLMLKGCTDLMQLDLGEWETDSVLPGNAYCFMNKGTQYNGQPWEKLFPAMVI